MAEVGCRGGGYHLVGLWSASSHFPASQHLPTTEVDPLPWGLPATPGFQRLAAEVQQAVHAIRAALQDGQRPALSAAQEEVWRPRGPTLHRLLRQSPAIVSALHHLS